MGFYYLSPTICSFRVTEGDHTPAEQHFYKVSSTFIHSAAIPIWARQPAYVPRWVVGIRFSQTFSWPGISLSEGFDDNQPDCGFAGC